MKRTADLLIASVGLLVLSPLLLFVALAIWWRMGSPILFKQERPGRYGRPFMLLKFRTMRTELDASGVPLPDGERMTPLGNILRRTSLDEVPELFNVIRGDMSLVGPRPLLMEYLRLYTEEQSRRHEVRPGVTGWAQINGRNAISWEEKFRLDVWYVDHRSFLLDMQILLKTVVNVIFAKGVSQPGHATTERFTGLRH